MLPVVFGSIVDCTVVPALPDSYTVADRGISLRLLSEVVVICRFRTLSRWVKIPANRAPAFRGTYTFGRQYAIALALWRPRCLSRYLLHSVEAALAIEAFAPRGTYILTDGTSRRSCLDVLVACHCVCHIGLGYSCNRGIGFWWHIYLDRLDVIVPGL